ncbi:PREDICTED: perlwapin-like isoform X2 [Habropoda laboriosa]|uniref:perlwapin-like isoform X2 n=1 Tax=Habropoda laboriosa TaxID=597456 RepID=UPI00083E09BA|nr:PREDICTED: perlwapin-like isoform X2 [Habropoda laboriosa]
MKLLPVTFTLTLVLATSHAQSRYEPFAEKPGSCPPALPVQICTQSCFSDSHCSGIGKCCPTNCGGFVCSKPVTMRQTNVAGSCPAVPKGRWVCSPTCSVDTDCKGTLKCCKNRCGALACQKPDVEVIESLDIPVSMPEDPYNVPRNPYDVNRNPYNVPRNPYNVPRNPYGYLNNPNSYPYYFYNN